MAIGVDGSKLHGTNYVPPDGGWGWVVVFSSFMIHFIMDGITYSMGAYLTSFTEFYQVSRGEASFVHALLPAITLGSGPIASIFTNKYGCRLTTIIGSAIATVGFLLSYFVSSFYLLYVTIGCVVGIGFGIVYVPAIVSVGYYFEKYRSLAIGIAVCGAGVGTFFLSPFNRLLEKKYELNGAFLILGGLVFNMCVLGILIRPVPVEPSEISKMRKKVKANLSNAPASKHRSSADETCNLIQSTNVKQVTETLNGTTNSAEPVIINTENDATENAMSQGAKKIGDSLPAIYLKNPKNSSSLKINSRTTDENKFLKVESHVNDVAKSMPMLNQNRTTLVHAPADLHLLHMKHKIKSMNSAMDILAFVKSSQNVHLYNYSKEDEEKEQADERLEASLGGEIDEIDGKPPKGLREKLARMTHDMDFALLKDPVFIFFAVSNFLTSLGFNTPYIYIVDQAIFQGIPSDKAVLLLSTIGVSNTVGRVLLGLLSDMKWVNRLHLYSSVITICGISTIIEPFCTSFTGLLIYAIVFGFTSGGYVSLTSVLLVDLLGLDKLTNAFGFLLVFQGIATSFGPPSVGILFDNFNSYVIPFVITGILVAISGVMCFFIPCLQSKSK